MKYINLLLVAAIFLIVSISACSIINDKSNIAQVKFRLQNTSENKEDIAATIDFVSHEYSKTISSPDSLNNNSFIGPFRVSTSGPLDITARLLNSKKEPVATNAIQLPLHSDLQYSITISIGSYNPIETCFGCQGSKAVSLSSILNFSATDSLYIVWGSNSIENPVYY
ncbi:MAG: hypothetical protein JXR20_03160 [Balneola sp.]